MAALPGLAPVTALVVVPGLVGVAPLVVVFGLVVPGLTPWGVFSSSTSVASVASFVGAGVAVSSSLSPTIIYLGAAW